MQVGRKIYYEVNSGNVILITTNYSYIDSITTKEQDIANYAALQPYQPNAVGVIQLTYGDTAEQNSFKYPCHIDVTKNPIDETAIAWDTANPLGATLAQVQASKIAQITDLYNQKLTAGFTSSAGGVTQAYGYASTDQMKFMQVALKVLLKGVSVFPVTVHPKDGSDVSLDQTQYAQLIDDIAAFAEPLDAQQHAFINQANACTTVDAVNAITVTF